MAFGNEQVHYRFRGDVGRIRAEVLREFGPLNVYTYVGHPWPGWDGQSFDVFGPAGLLDPLPLKRLHEIRRYLMQLDHGPYIRHTILGHTLWTSFGGPSRWAANDHSGKRRHLHVTYW